MWITVESASVRLGRRTVFDGISMVVRAGEIVGLVGPNGAGKTTLLRVLSGLIVPRPGAPRQPPTDRVA